MVRSITQCSNSISLYTTTKENVSIPTGSAPYTQLIFNFDGIGNKTIVGVTEIWSSRPSVVRIAQFNPLNNNQLEVWIGNAVSSASSANVRVTVAAMQLQHSISPVSVECDLNANAQGQKIKLSKVGKLVTMSIGSTQLTSNLAAWSSRQIATIPLGFRPKDEKIYAALCTDNGVAAIKVGNGGVLNVESRRDAIAPKLDLFANASWVTDQYSIYINIFDTFAITEIFSLC